MIRIVGSSPLARGLRVSGRERSPCGGIIPARAGFTETGAVSAAPGRDHPRSRGVYREGIRVDQANVGSSPLARGLLGLHGARLQGLRIIPARAGFTSLEQVGKREEEDHPRSRGVYLSTTWPGMGSPGSSPLARGLPHRHGAEPVGEGIIPARAGFTTTAPYGRAEPKDHPRSRGVYQGKSTVTRNVAGSSPLARGLLRDGGSESQPARIIPARAGFTRFRGGAPQIPADHPRSRGVYE